MSYTPTEWSTGDTITAALLNKMENGIAAGGASYDGEVLITGDGYNTSVYSVASGTYEDIAAILSDGGIPRIKVTFESSIVGGWESDIVAITYYAPSYSVPYFTFSVLGYNYSDSAWTGTFISWDAEDNVYI